MIYTYSLSTDFPNGINTFTLHKTIVSSVISVKLYGVTAADDNVFIEFQSALSIDELTSLNNLIQTHDSTSTFKFSQMMIMSPNINVVTSPFVSVVGTFVYEGSWHTGKILKITVTGNKDIDATNYYIGIYDRTNNIMLTSGFFTNNICDIVELPPLTNIPQDRSVIDILSYRTSNNVNNKSYLSSVMIYV